jgi:formate-dependent nitrite reductase membrane component NrfD
MSDGASAAGPGQADSYYGRPILKEPTWTWEIPVYFFTGGLGGASSVLSLAARALGRERLARVALHVGAAAEAVSPALLVSDLGRPERFLNMLRVLKPTSPMSVGSWILTVSGSATMAVSALDLLDRLPRVKLAAEIVAALSGPPLATYTGVLVADTAVPVWHEGREDLPIIFGASAGATAGAAATLFLPPGEAGPARRLAVLGVVAELALMERMRRRLGFLGEPYRKGPAGALRAATEVLAGGGAAVLALRGRRRGAAAVGAAMVLAGEMCLRWSVFRAGFQSARDPRYTVEAQRERA